MNLIVGCRLTLNSRVNSLAQALLALGLKKGDKVATLLRNSNQLVEVYLATAKIGAVFAPFNYRLHQSETVRLVNHSDASLLVFGAEFARLVDSVRHRLSNVKRCVSIGNVNVAEVQPYEQLIAQYPSAEPDVEVKETDVCQLLYTSGTTGKPRGVAVVL